MKTEPIIPPFLKKGDTIGLVATARFIEDEALNFAVGVIESYGLRTKVASNAQIRDFQLAGDDEMRIAGFNEILHDPEVKALLVVRGGYGTVRIVDQLDWDHLRNHPKWICGFSDVTVLLNYVSQQLNMAAIHCAMPVTYRNNTPEALDSLFLGLMGKNESFELRGQSSVETTIEAPIVGGNLSVIYSQLGSNSQIDARGKILFLEDLDEYLYHVDRMFWALKRAGVLDGIKALLLGGFTALKDNTVEHGQDFDNPWGKNLKEIVSDVIDTGIPVVFDVNAGHLADNRALMLGRSASVKINSNKIVVKHRIK